MARIHYKIQPRRSGWCIACGETVGPPYNRKSEAIRDAAYIASLLRKSGDEVDVVIEQFDGQVLQIAVDDVDGSLRRLVDRRKDAHGDVSLN